MQINNTNLIWLVTSPFLSITRTIAEIRYYRTATMTRWRLRWMFDMTVRKCAHISSIFLRKRLTFGWCQMIEGFHQLTKCCRITVVWVDPATMTLLRRWSCCCSDVTSVADQWLQACCCRYRCRFSGDAPQCNFRSTAVEFWLTAWRSKSLIYYTLVITVFHQFKSSLVH